MLSQIYKSHKLIRTRDEIEIKNSDIVIDVGGIYDMENDLFDHL